MMLRLLTKAVITLVMIAAMPSFALATDFMPPAFTATYQLHKFGLNAAQASVSLQAGENGTWIYQSHTITKGMLSMFRDDEIIETTTLKVNAYHIKPIRYSYQHKGSKKNRDRSIEFDWDNKQAKSVVRGQSSSLPILDNTLDSFSLQLQMMIDLSNKGLAESYSILKKGELEEYRFQRLDHELVTTPAGDFKASKFLRERENSNRKTIMWTTAQLNHLPIKITHVEDDGTEFTLLLSNIKGLKHQGNEKP